MTNVDYVAVVGDSYTSGSPAGGHGPQSWIAVVTDQLQKRGVPIKPVIGAVGASGYVAPGHQKAGTFNDQVIKVAGYNERLIVLFGSRNDAQVPAEQLTPAVQHTLNEAKQLVPHGKLLVISPVWPNSTPSLDILRTRDVLKAEAAAAGAAFVDTIADHWFWDRPDLIGPDGVHPTDAGHVYMAERIAPVMAQLLASTQTP